MTKIGRSPRSSSPPVGSGVMAKSRFARYTSRLSFALWFSFSTRAALTVSLEALQGCENLVHVRDLVNRVDLLEADDAFLVYDDDTPLAEPLGFPQDTVLDRYAAVRPEVGQQRRFHDLDRLCPRCFARHAVNANAEPHRPRGAQLGNGLLQSLHLQLADTRPGQGMERKHHLLVAIVAECDALFLVAVKGEVGGYLSDLHRLLFHWTTSSLLC